MLLEQEPADASRRDAYIACRKLGQIYALRKEWADTLGMYRLARERLELVEDPAYRDSLRRDEAALWRLEGDALRWLQQTDEAAAYLGVSKSYIYRLTSRNEIPCYKPLGKMCYFDRSELEEWIRSNRAATDAEIRGQ